MKVHKVNLENNLNIFQFLLALNHIRKLINEYKPKVVHAHLLSMELIGAIIKFNSKHNFKFIITKHLDSFFLEASFGHRKFFRGIMIDKFIINQAKKSNLYFKSSKNVILLRKFLQNKNIR